VSLPPVTRGDVLEAMRRFDQGERSPIWRVSDKDWTDVDRHHWAVPHGGQLYPVKEIIRLAARTTTGEWPATFWGGTGTARFLRRLGFTPARRADWASARQASRGME